ncbi:MAG: hypothetical protein UMS36scaffold28_6 [Phage 59_13]|nr:MAG: hypothetical protein UMS36scaffold28_6 [Phage 59_13]
MDILTILIILFLVGAIGSAPGWGWHHYSYYPSGGFLILLIIVLLFMSHRGP